MRFDDIIMHFLQIFIYCKILISVITIQFLVLPSDPVTWICHLKSSVTTPVDFSVIDYWPTCVSLCRVHHATVPTHWCHWLANVLLFYSWLAAGTASVAASLCAVQQTLLKVYASQSRELVWCLWWKLIKTLFACCVAVLNVFVWHIFFVQFFTTVAASGQLRRDS